MKRSLSMPRFQIREEAYENADRVPLLAAGDDDDEAAFIGTLYKPKPAEDSEEQVLQYAAIHNGNVDVTDASTVLKMPSDEVEQAMLTLMAQGKVKVDDGGSSK